MICAGRAAFATCWTHTQSSVDNEWPGGGAPAGSGMRDNRRIRFRPGELG
jgi:hypothetical protein